MTSILPTVTQLVLGRQFDFKAHFFYCYANDTSNFLWSYNGRSAHFPVSEPFMLNAARLSWKATTKDF